MKKLFQYSPFIIALIFFSCKGDDKNKTNSKPVSVEVYTVQMNSDIEKQNYSGVVEESHASILSFQIPGSIKDMYVGDNQRVTKGQILASLDKTTLQYSHDAAISTLKQAEDAYRRLTALYENGSLPEIKWIEAKTSLQQAKSMESIASKSLRNCNLYAPMSGFIGKLSVEIGTNVMPTTPVFKLVSIDKVKIKIALPENEIANTSIGQMAQIKAPAIGANQVFNGLISEKGVVANTFSHTYEVKITLENHENKLMPGMTCSVCLSSKSCNRESQIVIPNHAIQIDNNKRSFLWVAKNGLATKRIIQTAALSDFGVVVSKGLNIGDLVIIKGNQKVSEAMRIIIR